MGVLKSGGEPNLALEALGTYTGSKVRVQHLHDHASTQSRVLGDKDAAHAATAKLALERVAAA
jgi:hypothetical protein